MSKPFGTDIPSSTSAGLRTVELLDEARKVMRMQAEQIERLQMAVGLASTIRGEVSDWLADPLKMMQEVVRYVEWMRSETERQVQRGKRLDEEIERLRADNERLKAKIIEGAVDDQLEIDRLRTLLERALDTLHECGLRDEIDAAMKERRDDT